MEKSDKTNSYTADPHSELEAEIIRSKTLPAGAENYRSYVGPPLQYDFMGATQFNLLSMLGLREESNVLDIGCGSLRAGKLLLQYLMPERYFGIEPNDWLWKTAVEKEIGRDILRIKKPYFSNNDQFSLQEFEANKFDFVVSQSIYSHTGLDLFEKSLIEANRVLKPNGQFLFTVISPGSFMHESFQNGEELKGWIYPECVWFSPEVITSTAHSSGLLFQKLDWFHPRQIWYRAVKSAEMLLTEAMLEKFETGAPLFDNRF